MRRGTIVRDTRAAATELGYIFTFLLGVLLLTMFSVWAWDIETNTRLRWNEEAIQANMDDLAAAVERADEASRLGGNISYAEEVSWRPTEADESLFLLELTDTAIKLIDKSSCAFPRAIRYEDDEPGWVLCMVVCSPFCRAWHAQGRRRAEGLGDGHGDFITAREKHSGRWVREKLIETMLVRSAAIHQPFARRIAIAI